MSAGCDFVMLGTSGFIGGEMLRAVQASGYQVQIAPGVRLHQRTELKDRISSLCPRFGIICCAGTRGNPNIDWCDDHPVETVDTNVTGQLNVATVCHELALHCVLIGTGFVYSGKDGKVYTEGDPPDSELPKVYAKLRIALEQLLAFYPNVLNLRVMYPISRDIDDKRSLIGKIATFKAVDDVSTCCTFLEDLCPLVPHLMQLKVSGNLNFVNPGVVRYRDIVQHLHECKPGYAAHMQAPSGRPAVHLDSSRLVALCGDFNIPTAQESLARIFSQAGKPK